MAVSEYNLRIQGRSLDHELFGPKRLVREYDCWLDAPETDESVLRDDPLVLKVGQENPDVQDAIVTSSSFQSTSQLTHWIHRVTHVPLSELRSAGEDVSFKASYYDPQNPLKANISWSEVHVQRPIRNAYLKTPDFIQSPEWYPNRIPITSSVGLLYTPMPTEDRILDLCTYTRNEIVTSPRSLRALRQTLNNSNVTLDGESYQPHTLLMLSVDISEYKSNKDSEFEQELVYRTVTRKILVDEAEFHRHILVDQDYYRIPYSGEEIPDLATGLPKDPGQPVPIFDPVKRTPVSRPFPLDGFGRPIEFDEFPPTGDEIAAKLTFRTYRNFEEASWSSLNLH